MIAAFAADNDAMCPGEDKLPPFSREVLDAVFWEEGGINRFAMHSESSREVLFRVLLADERDERVVDGFSVHMFNLGLDAPLLAPSSMRHSNAASVAEYIETPRFSGVPRTEGGRAEQLNVFFIRNGMDDQAEIERLIDERMRQDGSSQEDSVVIEGCRISRLRNGWEIGSTKLILPKQSSRKRDLECAVSALFFHYGISNPDYIQELEKAKEFSNGDLGASLEKSILRGLYSSNPSNPSFEPGLTRCEAVTRLLEHTRE